MKEMEIIVYIIIDLVSNTRRTWTKLIADLQKIYSQIVLFLFDDSLKKT